ncbi:MAG TPA: hypothetical protein VMH49_01925 [Thermoplasmata archaeon]|nr:hypothetical protein [Thermoplasmata archaeon]
MTAASRRPSHPARPDPPPAAEGLARLELDLPHELLRPSTVPLVREVERWLHEQQIEEQGSLLVRAAELLQELGAEGYDHVDHWEIDPVGWLPLPEATHEGRLEPVGHLIRALRHPAWGAFARARSFSVRLSASDGRRIDARILRVHREREHSICVDVWGPPATPELRRIAARLRSRFAPLRMRLRR